MAAKKTTGSASSEDKAYEMRLRRAVAKHGCALVKRRGDQKLADAGEIEGEFMVMNAARTFAYCEEFTAPDVEDWLAQMDEDAEVEA